MTYTKPLIGVPNGTSVSTNASSTEPYYNFTSTTEAPRIDSIPLWSFTPSPCDWDIPTYIDVILSCFGVINNALLFLIPFFYMNQHNVRGVFLCSYTAGAFFCSVYFAYFDIRYLVNSDASRAEKGSMYWLIHFQAYHVVFHLTLLSWDQYKCVFQCNSHVRFMYRSKTIKIMVLIWGASVVHPFIDACFMSEFGGIRNSREISQFRLVCVFFIWFFFWFGPFIAVIIYNSGLFRFLLRVMHNGYRVGELKPDPRKKKATRQDPSAPRIERVNEDDADDEEYEDDEPKEPPVVPDDVRLEYDRTFVHLVLITVIGTILLIWFTYSTLALLNRAGMAGNDEFRCTIYNCYIYITLFFFAKLIPLTNPLGLFYYKKELRKIFCFSHIGQPRRQDYSKSD